jgi:pimeloyl-ACP methyl ester carboxylesterase
MILTVFPALTETYSQAEKGYAPVNGLQMYYEIHGKGKGDVPLVLIHGGGSTIESNFGTILPLLSENRWVIALELQVHGRTSDRQSPLTFEQDADDVAALLLYLKILKADLLGFSNGGNTAMQVAIRHPDKVNKLIIASSFYKRTGMISGFFDIMQHASLDNMPEPLKEAFLRVASDTSLFKVMFNKDRERMVRFSDWPEADLKSIDIPVLIIAGDHDVVTIEHTVEMSRLLPKASLVILPGNHGSYLGEICTTDKNSRIPGITVGIVEEFLDER